MPVDWKMSWFGGKWFVTLDDGDSRLSMPLDEFERVSRAVLDEKMPPHPLDQDQPQSRAAAAARA